jgi:hypothetical protein
MRGVLVNASQLLAGADDPAPIVQEMIDYRGTNAAALQTMIDRTQGRGRRGAGRRVGESRRDGGGDG